MRHLTILVDMDDTIENLAEACLPMLTVLLEDFLTVMTLC